MMFTDIVSVVTHIQGHLSETKFPFCRWKRNTAVLYRSNELSRNEQQTQIRKTDKIKLLYFTTVT